MRLIRLLVPAVALWAAPIAAQTVTYDAEVAVDGLNVTFTLPGFSPGERGVPANQHLTGIDLSFGGTLSGELSGLVLSLLPLVPRLSGDDDWAAVRLDSTAQAGVAAENSFVRGGEKFSRTFLIAGVFDEPFTATFLREHTISEENFDAFVGQNQGNRFWR